MTCDFWRAHGKQRTDLLVDGSSGRLAASAHLEICPECRSRAFLLDPSWARLEEPNPDFSQTEIDETKRRILAGRRLSDVADVARVSDAEAAVSVSSNPKSTAPRNTAWLRAAAIAASLGVLLMFGVSRRPPSSWAQRAVPVPEQALSAAAGLVPNFSSIDPLLPTRARVYELGQADFSLVILVDESLDI